MAIIVMGRNGFARGVAFRIGQVMWISKDYLARLNSLDHNLEAANKDKFSLLSW